MTLFKKTVLLTAVVAIGLFNQSSVFAAEEEKDDSEKPLLEAVGGLSAAFFFQTQQTIGMLHDAKVKEVYDAKVCAQLLQVTINLIGVVDKQMVALTKTELDDADQKSISQFHTINKLLLHQAEELKEYWDADDEDHKAKYHEYRKKSEAKINQVLGIGDKEKAEEKEEKEE